MRAGTRILTKWGPDASESVSVGFLTRQDIHGQLLHLKLWRCNWVASPQEGMLLIPVSIPSGEIVEFSRGQLWNTSGDRSNNIGGTNCNKCTEGNRNGTRWWTPKHWTEQHLTFPQCHITFHHLTVHTPAPSLYIIAPQSIHVSRQGMWGCDLSCLTYKCMFTIVNFL